MRPKSAYGRRRLFLIAQSTGLFTLCWLYIALRIRPELFYLQDPRVFLFTSDFFYDMVDHPGGGVDYLSAFLSPLMSWNWLGALILALLVAFVCAATRGLLAAVRGKGGDFVFMIPAVLLLMVLDLYCHPVRLCVGLSLVLIAANCYVRLNGCHAAIRFIMFLLTSAVIYFTAAGLVSAFGCFCGCFELRAKRQYLLGALCVLCAVAIPLDAGVWYSDLRVSEAFQGLFPVGQRYWLAIPSSPLKLSVIYSAAIWFPLAAGVVFTRTRKSTPAPVSACEESSGEERSNCEETVSERNVGRIYRVIPVVMLLLLLFADVTALDLPKRCLLEVEFNNQAERWDDVLTSAAKLPPSDKRAYDLRVLYCLNRALYFKGCLLDRMFAYPQAISVPSLALIYNDIDTTANLTPEQCSEVFFDLGRVNESEQMAYEALELYGNRPEILKRLVYINVIKNEPNAARRFLSVLECSLLHRGWARDLREKLDADSTLPGIPQVASRRKLMVEDDSVGDAGDLERLLEGLLEKEPKNRMALEYLMAHYLLTRQLEKVAANCDRFDSSDYPEFPRHIQEALAIYMATTGIKDLDFGSRSIHPETWRRFDGFLGMERQVRGDVSAAFAALYPDFHDSYFFSFVFGHNSLEFKTSGPSQ